MYITCKCLNVSVKTRSDELKEFDRDTINDLLINKDCYCEFFHQPLATVNELEGINKVQCGLVVNKYIRLWCIHRCINCSMYTHAVHRNYGAGLVLINKNMITSIEEIEKLKLHPKYSEIFKIIIDYNHLYDDNDEDNDGINDKELSMPLTKYSMSQLPNKIQLSLTNLQQQLEQAIQKQVKLYDEKIRAFTDEQYQLMEQYRERAHVEYNLLSRMICDNNCNHHCNEEVKMIMTNNNKENNDVKLRSNKLENESPMDSDKSHDANCEAIGNDNDRIIGDGVLKKKEHSTLHASKLNRKIEKIFGKNSDRHDCGDIIFTLEGIDDTIGFEDQETNPEIGGSDTEDSGQDEGIHIPRRQRSGHPTLAKSLPVSVPNFSTLQLRAMRESHNNRLSMDPLDPHNIRASIKALAKSVHGDAVFGDLPRPRFSTQI